MEFVETPIFTKQIDDLLSDREFHSLQLHISHDPEAAPVMPGTGGLRKIRWAGSGRGKRGGIRVIYYLVRDDRVYLLFAYPKNKQENLTSQQLKVLRKIVEMELP